MHVHVKDLHRANLCSPHATKLHPESRWLGYAGDMSSHQGECHETRCIVCAEDCNPAAASALRQANIADTNRRQPVGEPHPYACQESRGATGTRRSKPSLKRTTSIDRVSKKAVIEPPTATPALTGEKGSQAWHIPKVLNTLLK